MMGRLSLAFRKIKHYSAWGFKVRLGLRKGRKQRNVREGEGETRGAATSARARVVRLDHVLDQI